MEATPRRGRPSKDRPKILVRIDPEALRRLDAYAARSPEHDGRGDALSAILLELLTASGRPRRT